MMNTLIVLLLKYLTFNKKKFFLDVLFTQLNILEEKILMLSYVPIFICLQNILTHLKKIILSDKK